MMTTSDIVDFVEDRVGHLYARPLMYRGTADGVDLILHYYHELWATIHERLERRTCVLRTLKAASERPARRASEGSGGVLPRWRVGRVWRA
jgi:hypothetical protein